jgi:hypothetical protein
MRDFDFSPQVKLKEGVGKIVYSLGFRVYSEGFRIHKTDEEG